MADENFPLDTIASRSAALAVDGSRLPALWTPEHVVMRLIEAMKTLRFARENIGPSMGSGGWPPALMAAAKARDAWLLRSCPQQVLDNLNEPVNPDKDGTDAQGNPLPRYARDLPSRLEIAMMEEALAWPLSHINEPIQADALSIHCMTHASPSFAARPLLADRLKTASLLAWTSAARREDDEDKQLRAAGMRVDDPGFDGYSAAVRCVLLASDMRRTIAKEVALKTNKQLKHVTSPTTIREIRIEARDEFIRRCKEADLSPTGSDNVQEIMPGQCLFRWQVDRHRKRAAERIAGELNRAGVAIR